MFPAFFRLVTLAIVSFIPWAAHSANPIVISNTTLPDASALLSWSSQPGALYRVESAETLIPGLNGSIQWIPRAERLVSHGAQTQWMDYGDPSDMGGIYHPYDTSQRFYRVTQVAQATGTALSVSISAPAQNSTVSGDIQIQATVATTVPVNAIRVFVDGQEIDSAIGVSSAAFTINTTEYMNGAHRIIVTAEAGGEVGSTGVASSSNRPLQTGVSAVRTLNFNNYISEFTLLVPYFDPYNPFEMEIQVGYAYLAANSEWTVDVVDENDTPVASFAGTGEGIYFEWDGTNDFGEPLPPGIYDYILTATRLSALSASSFSTSSSTSTSTPKARAKPRWRRVDKNLKGTVLSAEVLAAIRATRPMSQKARTQKSGLSAMSAIPTAPLPKRAIRFLNSFDPPPPSTGGGGTTYPPTPGGMMTAMGTSTNNGQTTRNPGREPGRKQMSFDFSVGAAAQGHHPDTPLLPPLSHAGKIATDFVSKLTKGSKATKFPGLKKGFLILDDEVTRQRLVGKGWIKSTGKVDTSESYFNRYSNFGMLVGHSLYQKINDPYGEGAFGKQIFYPVYSSKTGRYDWVPLWEMRLGSQFLLWMAVYGCNVAPEQYIEEWKSRGTIPLSSNLNLYLGTNSTIWMYPTYGHLFAQGLQGEHNGQPMTFVDAWLEAGRRAHRAEKPEYSVSMSWFYWDQTDSGSGTTKTDKLKWGTFKREGVRTADQLVYEQEVVYTPAP